jgi:acyl-CoA synthetase (NDP forming)
VRAQRKPILVYTYTIPSEFSRGRMAEAGLPVFANLADVGRACRHMIARARFVPPAEPPRIAVDVPQHLLAKSSPTSGCLSEYDSKTLLRACGVDIGPERLVVSADDLDAAMQAVGFPLALKLQSADLPHKSDVGGVKLGVADRDSGRRASEAMFAQVQAKRADAAIQGVLVSPMAAPGVEIIVGTMHDATFGPMIMVGLGGIMTELYGDVVYRLAPVGLREAQTMLGELKGAPLLQGFRGSPPADVAALASLVARVSAIATALGEGVAEIELNPVIVHPAGQGVTIADALVVRSRPRVNPMQKVPA